MSSVALKDYENATFNGFAKRLRPKNKKLILPEFAVYLFRSNNIRTQILAFSSLTTRASLNASMIKEIKVMIPPLSEQSAIASILSSLDSKIELLQAQNKTLEAIGQAIFKHWFIDFEFPNEEGKPYKSFGEKMVYNEELGKEIPEGWKVEKLGDSIEFIKGRKPKDISEIKIDGYLPQILIDVLDGGKFIYANPENLIKCNENDIIMVMDGASSGRIETGFMGILGSTLAKIIITNSKVNGPYLYYSLLDRENEIRENTTGSAIPHTDKNHIQLFDLIIPDVLTLKKFKEIISAINNKKLLNRLESIVLFRFLEILLPKLLSGEVRTHHE